MKYLLILTAIVLIPTMCLSQIGTRPFNGRILNKTTGKGLQQISVNIVGEGTTITDSDGGFSILIPNTTEEVTLSINSNDWRIVAPSMPIKVVVSKSHITNILAEPTTSNLRIIEVRRLKDSLEQMEIKNDHLISELTKLKSNYDSIFTESKAQLIAIDTIKSQLLIKEDSVKVVVKLIKTIKDKINEDKTQIYNQLSTKLLAFKDEILTMEAALYNIKSVFLNHSSLVEYNTFVKRLDKAYTDLHQDKNKFVNAVEVYWNPSVSTELKGFYNFIFNDLYQGIYLPLKKMVDFELDKSWNGNKPRILAQRKAKKLIKEAKPSLRYNLNTFVDKISSTLDLLENEK